MLISCANYILHFKHGNPLNPPRSAPAHSPNNTVNPLMLVPSVNNNAGVNNLQCVTEKFHRNNTPGAGTFFYVVLEPHWGLVAPFASRACCFSMFERCNCPIGKAARGFLLGFFRNPLGLSALPVCVHVRHVNSLHEISSYPR